MKTIIDILNERVGAVMSEIAGQAVTAAVRPTQDARFGDYQANGVMGMAKLVKGKPRDLAAQIVEKLDVSDMCDTPEIAGPGFINFRLKPDWLAARLREVAGDDQRLGIDPIGNPPTTVVDFSGPNIAKQMHVGHLRSTIIGDVIARVLEFCYGDEGKWDFRFDEKGEPNIVNPEKKVLRQNHIGDWGTQFGMLLWYFNQKEYHEKFKKLGSANISDFEQFYREAKKQFDSNPDAAEQSKEWVVMLQKGSDQANEYWVIISNKSLQHCEEIYKLLGVELKHQNIRGESAYNDDLPSVLSELSVAKLLKESEGAKCVFLDGFKSKEGEPLPMIVQKSDGAYLYATTDLAAIRYRVGELKAGRIIYVTDSRQKLHFEMVFACAKQAGWAGAGVQLEHVPFGSVLGEDGKPFKTRSGENVKLKDLLDEAIVRAKKIVDEKNPDLPDPDKQKIAEAVGVGAVKYADLSSNLTNDYVFSWDKMLAMEGNTAPYMQYAYARVQSIFRKGAVDAAGGLAGAGPIALTEPAELGLAKRLLQYGEAVEIVANDLRPHVMTNYLFELAQAFSNFYTQCPVLKADGVVRASRLLLCQQTARTIRHGLGLLGIDVLEKM